MLIDGILHTNERVMNPGTHGGDSPLYDREVQTVVDLIGKSERRMA